MAELDESQAAEVHLSTGTDPDGTPVVILSGELDSSNVDALDVVVASVTSKHPARLVFDLSGLRFMDSAGIAVLVRAAAEVGTVQIRDPSTIVRRVLEITGLADVLRVEP